jgi:hypothetical protein
MVNNLPINKQVAVTSALCEGMSFRGTVRRMTGVARNTAVMYYNFAHVHQTLRVTLAMESGISNYVWSLEEIANLIPSKI